MSKPSQNGQDPKQRVNYRKPIEAKKDPLRTVRWPLLEKREERITSDELVLLLVVAEQTAGWNRPWVRLKNAEMADLAGMNERAARRVRNRLLDQGYIVRRRDPDDRRVWLYGLRKPDRWRKEGEMSREEIREKATPNQP
jgi:DNA-binding MarR family transcriptional regulator